MFLLTGLIFATWAARIPTVKANLGLSDGELAIAFVALNAGAVIGLQLGALVVAHVGSRATLLVALPLFAGMLIALALAVNLATLALALAVSACVNSVVDVAINEQGVGLERLRRRPLLSGLHAMHPLGGLIGSAVAALAARSGIPLIAHFGGIALLAALLAMIASRPLLPAATLHREEHGNSHTSPWTAWTRRLVWLGALAFIFTLAEGSALDWSAILLRDRLRTTTAIAATAVATFQLAVTLGRLLGDRLIDRLGPVTAFRAGCLLGGGGCAAGLLVGTPPGALIGFALLGLGLATLLPLSISAAGATGEVSDADAVARVSMLGYLGSFTGPALIGLLANRVGLASALLLPAAAVVASALGASHVRTAARSDPQPYARAIQR